MTRVKITGSGSVFALALLAASQIIAPTNARAQCASCVGDADANGEVTINELIQAVNNALEGCPLVTPTTAPPTVEPTATPTMAPQTPTPTSTPVETCPITPGAWSNEGYAVNAATSLALRAQLDTLVGNPAMRGVETGTVVLAGKSQLVDLFEAGDPSLADITTPAYAPVVDQVFDEFVALVAAGKIDVIAEDGSWTPGANGGIAGTSNRGLNAGGFEVRQLVDKGLYAGGGLYNYALGLTAQPITPATIDAIAAAFGSNENLDRTGMLTDSANYANQMGFFTAVANGLTAAKVYAADERCSVQRDEALTTVFRNWEQSMLARMVYYANFALTRFSGGSTDDDLIAALHEFSEGIALALSFRDVPTPTAGPLSAGSTTITGADIDEIETALGVNSTDFNASTTGLFVNNASGFAEAVTAVEQIVARVYGLSAVEIASYRAPTAG